MEREHGGRSGRRGRHHDRQPARQLIGDSRLVILFVRSAEAGLCASRVSRLSPAVKFLLARE